MAVALRRRRYRRIGVAAALLLLAGTSVWSHARLPAVDADWDGRPGVICRRVIDGDSIVIGSRGMDDQTVRLRGIDAPKVHQPGVAYGPDHDEPFAHQAAAAIAARLLPPGVPPPVIVVRLEGTETRDKFGRLLAYVYLTDSDCLNADLVRDGDAFLDRRFKTMLESQLDQLETQARTHGTGLWKNLKYADMPAWRQKWLDKKKLTHDN